MLHLTVLTLSGLAMILGQGSLPAFPARPNTTLIIAVYMGQFYPPITGLILSFLLGYFLDLMSGGLLGLNAFSMVSLCYLSFLLSKRILIQERFTRILVIFSFYLVYGGIVYLLFRFFNLDAAGYSYLTALLWDGSATAVVSVPVISAIKWMEGFFGFENERASTTGEIRI